LYHYADGTLNGSTNLSFIYDSYAAGRHLKATSGWKSGSGCEDTHGFSALPGGYGFSDGDFYLVGDLGLWWSASEGNSFDAYSRSMYYYDEGAYYYDYSKYGFFSVRCVRD
jgi:uncharacterized protein (TIGR02145 family)